MQKFRKPLFYAALAVVVLGIVAQGALSLAGAPRNAKLAEGDAVASWNWKGVYSDNGTHEKQVREEIGSLKKELGKEGEYEVLVGIAAQYELIGDGKRAYEYLMKAIDADPKKGLAYINLGHLMETLGAYRTAREAYDAAVEREPGNASFKEARDAFVKEYFPN